MKKNKAIIFDLDGVICYTDKFHYKAWKQICDEKGFVFDEKMNEKLKGVSRLDCYNIILKENNKKEYDEEKEKTIERKNNYYIEYLKEMNSTFLNKNIKTTLEELKKRNYLIAIGSSSKNTPLILERIGLNNFFDTVSDGNNIEFSKPNPQVFLKAAAALDIDPRNCFVVEDAYSGVVAGLNAEMKVFAYNQKNTNFKNKNVIKIENIKDLLDYL